MDALEFTREIKRMCYSYDRCDKCELFRGEAAIDYCYVDEIEKAIPIVEKWSAEHRKVTNREKLFEVLNKMSDRELADMIDLTCKQCPAQKFCDLNIGWHLTCQEMMKLWLKEDDNGRN